MGEDVERFVESNKVVKTVERNIVSKYNKLLVGIAGAVLTYLGMHEGASTAVKDAILIATVLGVYQVPNITKE